MKNLNKSKMKTKNTKFQNALIANDLLHQADYDYQNDPTAKLNRDCPKRFKDYVEKLEGLLIRLAHHLTNLKAYQEADLRENAKTERINIKSLKSDLTILLSYRPDWNEKYGITPEVQEMLLG